MVSVDTCQDFDARGVSIEVQLKGNIPFNSDSNELILLPEDELTIFESTLNELGISWQTYYNYPAPPDAASALIYGKLRGYYSSADLL